MKHVPKQAEGTHIFVLEPLGSRMGTREEGGRSCKFGVWSSMVRSYRNSLADGERWPQPS